MLTAPDRTQEARRRIASKLPLEQRLAVLLGKKGEEAASAKIITAEQLAEIERCQNSAEYFIANHVKITDRNNPEAGWFPFDLWPEQANTLGTLESEDKVLILKARQLGLSWLTLAYALHKLLFQPGTKVTVFSIGDTEAMEMLDRVNEMHSRLEGYLRRKLLTDNMHEMAFDNDSSIQSFPTTKKSGRSFTATIAIVDEAWFVQWFRQLINSVEPIINDGGQLIALSTADKEKPNHMFAKMWRKAHAGKSSYKAIFLPWHARPTRSAEWYAQQKADSEQDDLWQEYPESPEEAMAGRQANKRFQAKWIMKSKGDASAIDPMPAGCPSLPGLTIYHEPIGVTEVEGKKVKAREYVVSADTSEGDVTSDPTPSIVFDKDTWEEVALLEGIFEPSTQADYLIQLAKYFNSAVICPERNNHGHSVISSIILLGGKSLLYKNPFDKKWGWLSNTKYKPQAINKTADVLREGSAIINSESVRMELGNLESATLKAPEGDTDDLAMTYAIGVAALTWPSIMRGRFHVS